MVGAVGFEPTTSCSQGRRANQAALRPDCKAKNSVETKVDTLIPVFQHKRNPFFNFYLTSIFLCAIKIACDVALILSCKK